MKRLVTIAAFILGVIVAIAAPEWPQETLDHYNVFSLTNAQGCPKLPGLFFEKEQSRCITYIPSTNIKGTLRGNPAYRFSIPVEKDSFEVLPEDSSDSRPSCSDNPKIAFLRQSLGGGHKIEVIGGKANITHPQAREMVPDGTLCKVSVQKGIEI